MISAIICVIGVLVFTELFYFKVMLEYDPLGLKSDIVKVDGETKAAYVFEEALVYKFISFLVGSLVTSFLFEIFKNWGNEKLMNSLYVGAISIGVIGAVILFIWLNWVFTKRRQGNEFPRRQRVEGPYDWL